MLLYSTPVLYDTRMMPTVLERKALVAASVSEYLLRIEQAFAPVYNPAWVRNISPLYTTVVSNRDKLCKKFRHIQTVLSAIKSDNFNGPTAHCEAALLTARQMFNKIIIVNWENHHGLFHSRTYKDYTLGQTTLMNAYQEEAFRMLAWHKRPEVVNLQTDLFKWTGIPMACAAIALGYLSGFIPVANSSGRFVNVRKLVGQKAAATRKHKLEQKEKEREESKAKRGRESIL